MEDRTEIIYNSVRTHFEANPGQFAQVKRILTTNTSVSLRFIWRVVAVLANKNNLRTPQGLSIYASYKTTLRVYSQPFFDPFCRDRYVVIDADSQQMARSDIRVGAKREFTSSIAQLNFLRWLLDNHILQYIESNMDMLTNMSTDMAKPSDGKGGVKMTAKKITPSLGTRGSSCDRLCRSRTPSTTESPLPL